MTGAATGGLRRDRPPATGLAAPGFRPDIQGVRAVAVLLVVLHHLGGLGLPAGSPCPAATSGWTCSWSSPAT